LSLFFAIPFFNQAGFLESTLKSLIQQTDQDWRALVFDDSVDSAESVGARRVVQLLNDPRIIYRKNEKNLGLALNWNQAFSFSSESSLVGILHADDELAPEYVAKVKLASEEFPNAAAFFTKAEIIDHKGDLVFSFPDFYKRFLLPKQVQGRILLKGEAGLNSVLRGNFVFCPTLCFRSSKMEGVRFDPKYRMVLDLDLICRILLRGDLMVGLYSEPLYRYRRHATNATSILTRNMVRFIEERDLYLELAKKLSAQGFAMASRTAGRMRVIRLNLAFQILKSICGFRWGAARGFANFLLKEL
jgi:glycosyltransferase involved in cell wall biosynthesis